MSCVSINSIVVGRQSEWEPRPSKGVALSFAEKFAPLYAGALRDLQLSGGRFQFPREFGAFLDRIGSYVLLYDDEKKLNVAFAMGLFGEQSFKELNEESKTWAPKEQQAFLDELVTSKELEEVIDEIELPKTPEEWEKNRQLYESLPDDEKTLVARRAALFWGGFVGGFLNTISLMVHGVKLTDLVPRAISGEEEAFLKAVQIDRLLLIHHPFFRERKHRAQDNGEGAFLSKLAYRETNPPLRGKIRYPGLYMLFGILDAVRWLDDLSHNEILDLCDVAHLDLYQNRIEDVNYLTKRLLEYRHWQKTGGVSMH